VSLGPGIDRDLVAVRAYVEPCTDGSVCATEPGLPPLAGCLIHIVVLNTQQVNDTAFSLSFTAPPGCKCPDPVTADLPFEGTKHVFTRGTLRGYLPLDGVHVYRVNCSYPAPSPSPASGDRPPQGALRQGNLVADPSFEKPTHGAYVLTFFDLTSLPNTVGENPLVPRDPALPVGYIRADTGAALTGRHSARVHNTDPAHARVLLGLRGTVQGNVSHVYSVWVKPSPSAATRCARLTFTVLCLIVAPGVTKGRELVLGGGLACAARWQQVSVQGQVPCNTTHVMIRQEGTDPYWLDDAFVGVA